MTNITMPFTDLQRVIVLMSKAAGALESLSALCQNDTLGTIVQDLDAMSSELMKTIGNDMEGGVKPW